MKPTRMALMALVVGLPGLTLAQTGTTTGPASIPVVGDSPSDTLIFSLESDHVVNSATGGSGSFEWMHSTGKDFIFLGGVSSDVLGSSHWTLALGGFVWFHSLWIVETSLRVGAGSSAGTGFKYNDYAGTVTYKMFPHIFPHLKEEYVDVATSHGSLLSGGVCLCNIHRVSSTVSVAHSLFGNLATEYVSLREESASRLYAPFAEVSVGKILPTLINPALDLRSPSGDLLSFTVGTRFLPANRRNFAVAAAYFHTGATTTLSFSVAVNLRVRGD